MREGRKGATGDEERRSAIEATTKGEGACHGAITLSGWGKMTIQAEGRGEG